MYGRIKWIHFVGIGGVGMSGIAEVLLNLGYKVSGSDIKASKTTERLRKLGAMVSIGHSPSNIGSSDVVVVSSAVGETNCEVAEARQRGIPVIPRAEMLAELMRLKYGIAVAGSHGKTTTTTLVACVLRAGGFDPTLVVGGRVELLGTNAHLGSGDFIVVEADESDGSFLMLSPVISVVTNIDREHLDHHGSLDNLREAFSSFIRKIPFYGLAVLCADCPNLRAILPEIPKRQLTYGFSEHAELRAQGIRVCGHKTQFDVAYKGKELGDVVLNHPGRHNAQNALAAVAVGLELGMNFEQIKEGLAEFRGIERRLQLKGERRGIRIIDDYGHHPEEIKVTIEAIKESLHPKRLIVVFQPHRYTRTKLLFDDFAKALSSTDILYIIDIYPAGEPPIEGVSSHLLVERIAAGRKEDVFYESDPEALVEKIVKALKPGDVVLTMGAGNVWKVAERIAEEL
jgi:UDP-N-acetylmuramate--alanine ligase